MEVNILKVRTWDTVSWLTCN